MNNLEKELLDMIRINILEISLNRGESNSAWTQWKKMLDKYIQLEGNDDIAKLTKSIYNKMYDHLADDMYKMVRDSLTGSGHNLRPISHDWVGLKKN